MKRMTPKRLGRAMKLMRGLASLTREQLAERAEVSVESITTLERGERFPTLATLDRVMNGLSLDWDIAFYPREDPQA